MLLESIDCLQLWGTANRWETYNDLVKVVQSGRVSSPGVASSSSLSPPPEPDIIGVALVSGSSILVLTYCLFLTVNWFESWFPRVKQKTSTDSLPDSSFGVHATMLAAVAGHSGHCALHPAPRILHKSQ